MIVHSPTRLPVKTVSLEISKSKSSSRATSSVEKLEEPSLTGTVGLGELEDQTCNK